MRDRNQNSNTAQSGRARKGVENDTLEPTRGRRLSSEEVASKELSSSCAWDETGSAGLHTDRSAIEEADTDRFDIAFDGQLVIPSPDPTSITFSLRNIRSLNAKCFFCRDVGCEQVFMARSGTRRGTKAYAVHMQCILDHEAMQALASGER